MSRENQWLEDVFPIEIDEIVWGHVSFRLLFVFFGDFYTDCTMVYYY